MSDRSSNASERPSRPASLKPRDAATLIVVDRSGPEPRVLMGRRNPALAFMPGFFVFPGGRLEPGDRFVPALGSLSPLAETMLGARVTRGSASRSRALALAAIRETFEETGLLVGRRVETMPAPTSRAMGWEAFLAHNVLPDLSDLHFIGRAITPPGRPRRFDARFFAVERKAVAHTVEGFVGPDRELVETRWVTLAETEAMTLPAVTRTMLDALTVRLATTLGDVAPVPFRFARHGRVLTERL